MEFDNSKFKEMIHYVCRKMASEPEKLGAVKLHKILWYSEGHAYRVTGRPICGETYVKHSHGPFSTHLKAAVSELKNENRLHQSIEKTEIGEKHSFIGKGETNLVALSDRERSILDSYIDEICKGHTASSISEKSHDAIWEMAEMFEPIPLQAQVARFIKPKEEAIKWAKEEATRLGLL